MQAHLRNPLNASVSWQQVLPLLGVEAKSGALPLTVHCPLCGQFGLRIFDDSRFGGNWHYCPHCKSSGDMIELAARSWKCNIREVVRQLLAAGLTLPSYAIDDPGVANYHEFYTKRQERCKSLSKIGADNLYKGKVDVSWILQCLGLPKDQQKPYWRNRMGRFMGGCTKLQAVHAVNGVTNWDQVEGGRRAYFNGKGWRDVVAIPFHDLPGRCSALLFVGKHARPHQDYEFIFLEKLNARHHKQVETGFCMYDVLDSPTAYSERFGNTVFVFNDPIHALKLQAKQMRDSDIPLPLIATYNALLRKKSQVCELVAHDIWYSRPEKKFIFWGEAVSADLFDMASRADGYIWISKAPLLLNRQPPHVWLQMIKDNATHWTEVLESQLSVMTEDAAARLIERLSVPLELLQRFRLNCGERVRALLDRLTHQVASLRSAVCGSKTVCESENGWILQDKAELITDAILRIERVICPGEGLEGQAYYQGKILYGGQEIPFLENMGTLDRAAGNWMRDKVMRACGKLIVMKKGWHMHLLDIARQFHEPEVVCDDGRFGWKPADSCFSLPRFAVHLAGPTLDEAALVVDETAPAKELRAPETVPVDIKLLGTDTLSNKLFWATTACIGANILAPAIGQPLAGIGLVGPSAYLTGKTTALRHGCYCIGAPSVASSQIVELADRMEGIMGKHNWPIFVDIMQSKGYGRVISHWLNGGYARNAIMRVDPYTVDLFAMLNPWRFITDTGNTAAGHEIQLYGSYVLPLWLRRLCDNKLKLESTSELYVQRVLDDMATMMKQYGCNAPNIKDAGQIIDDATANDTEAALRFVSLIYQFIVEGTIRFGQDGYPATKYDARPAVVRVTSDDRAPGIFISRSTVDALLSRRGGFMAYHGKITEILKAANALDCECSYNDESGWLITEQWWSRQITTCQARHPGRLKVVGGD